MHLTLTVVFMSGVRSLPPVPSHAKIPGYQQYIAAILCNFPGTLLAILNRSQDWKLDFSDAGATASGWLKLRLPAPVRYIR